MKRWKLAPLRYWCNCVGFIGRVEELNRMIGNNQEITRRTFLKHVDRNSLADVEKGLGYSAHPSQGLTMAGDWAVSYHRSTVHGMTCYYFRHSAIEYIFTSQD